MILGQGTYGKRPINASLSHRCFPVSLPLSLKEMKKCPWTKIKKNLQWIVSRYLLDPFSLPFWGLQRVACMKYIAHFPCFPDSCGIQPLGGTHFHSHNAFAQLSQCLPSSRTIAFLKFPHPHPYKVLALARNSLTRSVTTSFFASSKCLCIPCWFPPSFPSLCTLSLHYESLQDTSLSKMHFNVIMRNYQTKQN